MSRRRNAGICQYGECRRKALYFIGWEQDGVVLSGHVCGTHDRELGLANLMSAYDISVQEAIALNTQMEKRARQEDKQPLG